MQPLLSLHIATVAMRLATLEARLAACGRTLERRYRPDQLRAPAGTPIGGQWIAAGEGTVPMLDLLRVAQAISEIGKHGIDQIINRHVSPGAILDALTNPLRIRPRPNGSTQYIGVGATVVLDERGRIVTAWRSCSR